jgi:transcriptional regulator with XRE-family HTH domain
MRAKRDTEVEFNITIGKIMERRRLAEGMTRVQMLRLMDEPRSTSLLCNYELGNKPVSLPFALRWCEVMGISLDQLLDAVKNDMNRQPSKPAALAGTGAGPK